MHVENRTVKMKYIATYSLEDNKLRLYTENNERLSPEIYKKISDVGFKYAPMQKLFYAPMWTPIREAVLIELAGSIENEEITLEQRAAERAERFEKYSSKRGADAENYANHADKLAEPFKDGQPILIGHHSQRKAERLRDKIQSTMQKAVNFYDQSNYWADRAAGVLSHITHKERPQTRINRIDNLQKSERKQLKEIAKKNKTLEILRSGKITDANKSQVFGRYDFSFRLRFTDEERTQYNITNRADDKGFVSVYDLVIDERCTCPLSLILERCIKAVESDTWASEWLSHYQIRIAYELQMLKASGHEMPDYKAIGAEKRAKTTAKPIINTDKVEHFEKCGSELRKVPLFEITKDQLKELSDSTYIRRSETFRYRGIMALHLKKFGFVVKDDNTAWSTVMLFIKDQKRIEVPTTEKVG